MRCEREREGVLEMRHVRWNSVGARIHMCHCLEKVKKIPSASSFNLYYR